MKKDERITAWVTKYALTHGICKVDARVCHSISSDMIAWLDGRYENHAHGREWHRSEDAAKARAEEMRRDKISSLKKQIAKLEKMSF